MPNQPDSQQQRGVLTQERQETREPPMYKVILLNDDYTPMDFVVEVLVSIFHKEYPDAVRIMLAVHRQGRGLAGVYTHEIAETKAAQVRETAKANEHPLQCAVEPA